jgi:FixJ family two-component response regulator
MDERGIIIADNDAAYRKEMAEFFEKEGYSVETTDSAIHVLCNILEKQTPVLLLGADFDKKISPSELIQLLKKCNRRLSIIVVSDDMPLARARQIRSEGIFYHALRPAGAGDTDEIGEAVKCAFKSFAATSGQGNQPFRAIRQVEQAGQVEELIRPEEDEAGPAIDSRTVQPILVITALVLGLSYLSLLAGKWISEGDGFAILLFLGFCALILTSQLLPIFRIKLPPVKRQQANQQEDLPLDGK